MTHCIMTSLRNSIVLLMCVFAFACHDDPSEEDDDSNTVSDPDFATPDWSEQTHSNDADANYDVVFPQSKVNTIEITMTASDWSAIQADMLTKIGYAFGSGTSGGGPGGSFTSSDPDYVAVSLKSNGLEWYKVGFRLKGNSSLSSSWRSGIYKLPFRLKFDEYEDQYPQIENQRFYGFKELSMSPGANDNSLIREKAGADIFRMAGIPCSQTAFYKVYIDFGSEKKYCGVYTMVEVVDDTMIKSQFDNDDGNIYKPESTFQSFLESDFEKKNNETENDYADVKQMVASLNSTLRSTNAAQWRTELEASINVDHFIKWLAINTTMLNWDTYGTMAHNYYLYNVPGNGLTWIPWDNNEAMSNRSNRSALTISLSGISASWPLIRYVIDDPVYNEKYKVYVKEFSENVFTIQKMNTLFDTYHSLISPYVIGPEETEQSKYTHLSGASAFTSALPALKQHVVTQQSAVDDYLN